MLAFSDKADSETTKYGYTWATGMLGDWRWSLSGNYGDADQRTFTDRVTGARDRFDSSQQSFGGSANLSGTVTEGWAGPIRLSMTGSYSGLRFDSQSERWTQNYPGWTL